MNTSYRPRDVVSPYQMMHKQASDVRSPSHPVMDEINKCLGTYQLEVIVEEDNQTLTMFKHVPGLIAFIATIRSNGRIVGQGRGSACLSSTNRFIERAVHCAFNSAVVDSVMRSTKVLDVLLPKAVSVFQDTEMRGGDASYTEPYPEQERYPARETYSAKEYAPVGISEKQKSFLLGLIKKIRDKDEQNQWLERMDGMTTREASEAIQSLKS